MPPLLNGMALPEPKYFRVIKGGTFDYSFQYLTGIDYEDVTPFDLTGYTGTWTLHPGSGPVTYSTGATVGHSGVFFGGLSADPTNGIIDLVISSADTTAITWQSVPYTFSIASPNNPPVVSALLTGAVSVAGVLP